MAGGLYGAQSGDMNDMPMGDDMPMGEESSEPAFEPKDDEERAYVDFMDEALPMEERVAAIKEAVRLCVEKQSGGGYSDEGPPSDKGKGGSGLALIFGEPKKKR